MAKKQKIFKPKARIPRGLRDMQGGELSLQAAMIETVAAVYRSYGFSALDTSALEYADALGKFLPDDDRPNEGVFSFEDDDGQWLSLRYDLTAPLARFVAEHYDRLPKPFRRYQFGSVFRNEKPGPGRYRQFLQIDADTVGASGQQADAEICSMAADCMEALGLARGQYYVRVNNRKILDGVLESIGLENTAADYETRRLTILRAIDKLDRLGTQGVEALLGDGRKDDSGDFTKGAQLDATAIGKIMGFVTAGMSDNETPLDRATVLANLQPLVADSETGCAGIAELAAMDSIFTATGYDESQIVFDPAVVRGLGYYTGPVFEIELTFEAENEQGELARFGSVGGGGRYDDLVKRFKGIEIPATGISIGVSRLAAALTQLGKTGLSNEAPLVVVLVMERDNIASIATLVQTLRRDGIRAEM